MRCERGGGVVWACGVCVVAAAVRRQWARVRRVPVGSAAGIAGALTELTAGFAVGLVVGPAGAFAARLRLASR